MNHPTAPGCEDIRHELGGYVLGGLDPVEARRLQEHLGRCSSCRVEYEELAALPDLLELAREPGPDVPSRLRDRVVAEATRRRSRRRWAAMTVAAALIAGLAGLGIGLQFDADPEPGLTLALQAEEPFTDASGWATVSRHPSGDGLVVTLEVSGLPPIPDPQVYEAWLYREDQRIVSIGQLEVSDGRVVAELAASGELADYRGFWITAEPDGRDPAHEGPTVLRSPIPDEAGAGQQRGVG